MQQAHIARSASRASRASTSRADPARERLDQPAERRVACRRASPKPPAASIAANPWTALRSARTAWISVVALEPVSRRARPRARRPRPRRPRSCSGSPAAGAATVVGVARRDARARRRAAPAATAPDRVGAGAPGRGAAQRRRQLARRRAPRAAREQAVAAVDVVVERRRAHAERRRDARERDRLEALGVGDRRPPRRRPARGPGRGAARSGPARDRAVHRRARASRRPCRGRARAAPGRARAARARTRARSACATSPSPGSGKRRSDLARGRDAAERRVGVGAVERAVAGVEERDVPGRVARARRGPRASRRGRRASIVRVGFVSRAGVAAAQLVLRLAGSSDLSLAEQARVARGDQDLGARQRGRERVERSRCGRCGRGSARSGRSASPSASAAARIRFSRAREHRVDEREPVVLLDEVGVDEAEAADLVNGHSLKTNIVSFRAASIRQSLRVLVVAPAAHLRAVADAVVGDVVERDLDDELGPQRDPLELALVVPAARVAHAALAGLVGREPRRQLALLGRLEAGGVADDAQLARRRRRGRGSASRACPPPCPAASPSRPRRSCGRA